MRQFLLETEDGATIEVMAFSDGETGIHLSIEHDTPEWPRITVYPPPQPQMADLSIEDFNAAISRLVEQAKHEGVWPQPKEKKSDPE